MRRFFFLQNSPVDCFVKPKELTELGTGRSQFVRAGVQRVQPFVHGYRECNKQPDEEWNPLFAEALYKKNYIEYLLDILLYGSLEERKALVAEQRKEVLKLEQRIAELSADRTMHSRRNPKQLRAERER